MIKLMLQKVTLSTIEWINGGFQGSPKFVQNPGEFFQDIAKTEILKFGMEINNPQLFPFGKAWMQQQVIAFQSKFAQNAQYSLNELMRQTTPQFTPQQFNVDFSAGGWSAWRFMTQVPANNPMGFGIMASNEWQKRLEGTVESPANEIRNALQQAGGFLGQEVCVDPEGMTKETHNRNLALGNPFSKAKNPFVGLKNPFSKDVIGPTQSGLSPYDEWEQNNQIKINNWNKENQTRAENWNKTNLCQRWEYQTPGKMIADRATNVVNYQDNLLLKAEDLNDAIAAVIDALLNRFSTDLMNKGFSELGYSGSSGSFFYDSSVGDTGFTTQTNQDFPIYLTENSNWLQENPEFNIRTDLTQAIIDEQRIYRDKLVEQNEVLSTLTKTIFQLDYCIPGPHPGWEEDSAEILNNVGNAIVPKTTEDMKKLNSTDVSNAVKANLPIIGNVLGSGMAQTSRWGKTVGSKVGSIVGLEHLGGEIGKVVGTLYGVTYGITVGFLKSFVNSDEKEAANLLSQYYAGFVSALTGLKMEADNTPSSQIKNKQEITGALNTLLDRYSNLISKYYAPQYLPTVTKDAAIEFNKAPGYRQIIANNVEEYSKTTSVITKLNSIKNRLDVLNNSLSNNSITAENYETQIQSIINEFGRVSMDMITGNNIAVVDTLTSQAKDEIRYVYEDLLTGPYGCENNLDNNPRPIEKGWLLTSQTRPMYPFPILYNYNNYKAGDLLPIPTEIIPYTTKTTQNKMSLSYSKQTGAEPDGFLNGVIFNNHGRSCEEYKQDSYVLDCIEAKDLFIQINTDSIYVNKIFEKTIGIY
jgi:hypothetical protein